MSEIAKCPHCGKSAYARMVADDFGYHHCGVSCDTAKLWNRYAAAMELAKATAAYAANIPPMGYPSSREFDAMQDAEERVIEVLNE